MADFKNYELGKGGVNVDSSPLHIAQNQLTKAQNAIRDRLGVDGGIKNRPGLVKYSASAGAGSNLGGLGVPAFGLIDTRTLYLAQQTGASAKNWYTSSDLFATNAVTTTIAAWQDPTAYCSTIGNLARMGVFLNGQLYYAGANYTSGTSSPEIRVFNGVDDRELCRILPATTFGVVAMHVSKGILYVLTLDSGTTDADWVGRVFRVDPLTGHMAILGVALATGYIPVSLCMYNDLVFVGTARATNTNTARIYRINPNDETAWTLDFQAEAGDFAITGMGVVAGLLHATTSQSGGAAKGKLLQRSVTGTWTTLDSTLNNAGSFEDCIGFGEYLYYSSRNYSSGTSTAVIRRTNGTTLATMANATATNGFGRLSVLGVKLFSVFGTRIQYSNYGSGAYTIATAPTTGIITAFGSLIRNGAAAWSDPIPTTVSHTTTVTNVTVSDNTKLTPKTSSRRVMSLVSNVGPGIISIGHTTNGAVTISGGTAQNNSATDSVIRLSNAVSGQVAVLAFNSNCTWLDHNPKYIVNLLTGADITKVRIWFGLTQAASQTNSDTISTAGCAFRYSTVAVDGGWIGVNEDSSAQTTTATIMAIAASTNYRLTMEVTGNGTRVTFTVENIDTGVSAFKTLATNIKTGVGMVAHGAVIPQEAATKTVDVRAIYLETGTAS